MKKIILLLLGVLMMLPTIARDFTYTYEGQTLTYTVLDEDAKTCKTKEGEYNVYPIAGNKISGNLIIPETANDGEADFTVTTIGKYAFRGCDELTSVTIPNSVTEIGNSAFRECRNLYSVTIPNSVTTLGWDIVGGNTFSVKVAYPSHLNLKESDSSSRVVSIAYPADAYIDGDGLIYSKDKTELYFVPSQIKGDFSIPNTIKIIRAYACSNWNPNSVIIPNSVTTIEDGAFQDSLTGRSVAIPTSVKTIGNKVFRQSGYMYGGNIKVAHPSNLSIPRGNESDFFVISYPTDAYFDEEGAIYDKDKTQLYYVPAHLTGGYSIAETVTDIFKYAFHYCRLTSVTIPASITSVDEYTFCYQTSLIKGAYPSHIENPFPSGVKAVCYSSDMFIDSQKVIYNNAKTALIYAPTSLSGNYTIPNSVKEIEAKAFMCCNGLKSVTFGSGLTKIGKDAFTNRYTNAYGITIDKKLPLDKVFWYGTNVPEGVEEVDAIINYIPNDKYNFTNQKIYPYLSMKFEVNDIVYVPVSPSERSCDVVDYNYSTENADLTISATVKNKNVELKVLDINDYSFYNYNKCNTLTIANSGSICTYAFADCNDIKSVNITSKGNIKESAFEGCKGLESVVVANEGNIGDKSFFGCEGAFDLQVQNKGAIGNQAFEGCAGIKSILIGTGVTSIGESAFSQCNLFPSTVIPTTITTIGKDAFSGCSSLGNVTFEDYSTDDNKVLVLGENAFSNCMLKNVYVGRDLEYTATAEGGWSPFYNCETLESVIYNDAETEITQNQFMDCSSLKKVTLGSGISSVKDSAFDGCLNLVNIDSISNVKSIGERAFANCSSLDNISLSNQLKTIPVSAFANCSSLSKITIPSSVMSIGNGAFKDCASLANICIEDSESDELDMITIGSNDFEPLFADCPLKELYVGRRLGYSTASEAGYSPFYGNNKLGSVIFNDAETEIYDNEFSGCTSLKTVKIGDGVESIGTRAFAGCSALETFSAGYNVSNIGDEAFAECTGLTAYHSYSAIPPLCGNLALFDIDKWSCELYIPAMSTDAYMAAPQWNEFFFISEFDVIPVSEIQLSHQNAVLNVGETLQLTHNILPSNATYKQMLWSHSDEEVAKVDENGLVTAIAPGEVEIKAMSPDSGKAESICTINVINNITGIDWGSVDAENEKVEIYTLDGQKIANTTKDLLPGLYVIKSDNAVTKIIVK